MKKIILLLLSLVLSQNFWAANFPKLSDDSNEYWYYLKFTQGNFVVGANGEGMVCKALIPMGKGHQLWKVEGSASKGYTFTNKSGLQLYVTGTSQGSEVRATDIPESLQLFKIKASGSNYTITPFTNTEQSFNSWGGIGLRNDIRLYKSSDANAPIEFVAENDISLSLPKINVVPYPAAVTMGEGTFDLHKLGSIVCFSDSTLMLGRQLAEDLQRTAAINVAVITSDVAEGNKLNLIPDKTLSAEAYQLDIKANGIEVRAADYGGFFNALQTLRQLMPTAIFAKETVSEAAWEVPLLTINDVPAMQHRGFHLDISRHFFDKTEVKKLLDMASVYKLNRFHWHLTDDQGWRVEIPEYPLLTTVGAIRKASLTVYDPTSGNKFFDDTEYGRGCYYTLDDLREIVAYARARNIEIIPEIDMPGHMTACIVAYPELGCHPEKKIEVMTEGGVSRDILNIGKDETIDFLKCVLGHLAEVFPYEMMHLGGDECPTTAWQENADCQRRIQREGLSGVNDLQPWLVEVLGSFLRDQYGKTVVVWDELLAHWNNAYSVKPVVMSWRGVDYARQAADKDLYSIMVPTRPLYFDLLQFNPENLEIDCPYMGGYGDGSVNSLENVYNFDPRSTVSGREKYVLGTQANLWTESCTSNSEAEYQYYPRLLALSEIAWLPKDKKNFADFYCRLQHQANVLRAKEITYAPHYFEPAEQTPVSRALAEAEEILNQSNPGAVGYPQQSEYDALQQAFLNLQAQPENSDLLAALRSQLKAYKEAPIVLPEAERYYQIVSASTYFRNRFDGSSLYAKGKNIAIHYTPQTEREELWEFVPQSDGTYQLVSALTGNAISIPQNANGTAKADKATGSQIVIHKAIKPAGEITYIPGVVNIKSGIYNLYAQLSGSTLTMVSSLDSTLCYAGTWRIIEVTDYRQWIMHIIEKAERIMAESESLTGILLTDEALDFLITNVLNPSRDYLSQDVVSRENYLDIESHFEQFMAMPKRTPDLDPSHYYLIKNAYYTTYYAAADANNKTVQPKTLSSTDAFRWYIIKNEDGTVSIRNKQSNTPAYVDADAEGQRLRLGTDYPWKLLEITTDQGNTATGILSPTGAFSWHMNTKSWTYVLLKPRELGASVWEFVKTDEEIPTGIQSIDDRQIFNNDAKLNDIFDLSGRRLKVEPQRGVFIKNGQKICK